MPEKLNTYLRRSLPEIKKLLKAQAKGNKSIAKFCTDNGIALATFSLWRKKHFKPETSPGFIKINTDAVTALSFDGIIEVTTPKGYSIKIEQTGQQTSLQSILKSIKDLSL